MLNLSVFVWSDGSLLIDCFIHLWTSAADLFTHQLLVSVSDVVPTFRQRLASVLGQGGGGLMQWLNLPAWKSTLFRRWINVDVDSTSQRRRVPCRLILPTLSNVMWTFYQHQNVASTCIQTYSWRLPSQQKSLQHPSKHKTWINAGLMLDQRRRRWANIKPTLIQCLVFSVTSVWRSY